MIARAAKIAPDDPDRILVTHKVEPAYLRAADFDAFFAARTERGAVWASGRDAAGLGVDSYGGAHSLHVDDPQSCQVGEDSLQEIYNRHDRS